MTLKQWPVIRHVRYFYLRRKFNQYWGVAKGFWITPHPSDLEYLDKVWRGEA